MQRWTAVTMMIVIAALSAGATAEDWPKWRGPRGDGIASGEHLSQQWPDGGPKVVWRVDIGAGYSSPVVVDGVIYMFTQEGKTDTLTALTAADRQIRWRKNYPTSWKNRKFPGTRSTPTIEGDRIYTMGGGGDLTCWNRTDGTILWRTNVLTETGSTPITWGSACSPVIDGKSIYVQCGKGGPTAVAVDKTTGAVLWQSAQRSVAGYATIKPTTAQGRDMLLVFGGAEIIAMDPRNGQTLWALPYETQYQINAVTPIVHNEQAFISHGYNKAKGTLLKLQPRSATPVWQNKVIRTRFITPIPENNVMYANDEGTLKCVRWADGEQVWACDDKRLALGRGGSIVRAGELLIVMSESGTLSLVHATPTGWEFRGQMRLFRQKNTWSTPMIYNGKLYVKSNDELVCLDISAAKAGEHPTGGGEHPTGGGEHPTGGGEHPAAQ